MYDQTDQTDLADEFERCRGHLRGVAFRMLGSAAEADDAVQSAWLRASRADAREVTNVPGWLTTIVSRVCLDALRVRRRRREDLVDLAELEPAVAPASEPDPEEQALLAESVGLALLVVLDALGPAERVAFVLHDLFAVPFGEIAEIVDRSPVATKQLASRARRRVRGAATTPAADLARQREVVDAFLAASRAGDLGALLAVLAPDVVRRADRVASRGRPPIEVRGAREVAQETLANAGRARSARAVLVDGVLGIVVAPRGRLLVVIRLVIDGDRVTEIDVVGDPARLGRLHLALPDDPG
jgi:RNA polymerase sigma factor (sigma-70 family)